MLTRRNILELALSSSLVGFVGCRRSPPSDEVGKVFDGEPVGRFASGALAVIGGGSARLGTALPGKGQAVFSIQNDNQLFAAIFALPTPPARGPFLVARGGLVAAESWGSGFGGAGGGEATFHLDRALADEIAGAWNTSRKDRVQLGAGMVGHFRPKKQPFTIGEPMEIVLELENTGTSPVQYALGARSGARDEAFEFVVEQNGKALPVTNAPEMDGFDRSAVLANGAKVELSADLSAWTRLDKPGHYRVRCHFHARLFSGPERASWPDHGHEIWDLELDGTLEIDVA